MASSTSVGIANSSTHHPSDEEVIKFITDNINNDDLLTDYFSKLKRPLTSAILALRFPINDTGEVYNLLGYAGYRPNKYFKYIVQLSPAEAIDAALFEDPSNDVSGTALHAILLEQTQYKKGGVVELIQKASREAISAALVKQFKNVTPLFMALKETEDTVAAELIKKANDDSINHAARLMYFGMNILEQFIYRKVGSQTVINAFLRRLSPETMNFLMSMKNVRGMTPFGELVAFRSTKSNERNDLLFCLFVSYTPVDTLNTLAKEKYAVGSRGIFKIDLLTLLFSRKRTPSVVDAILSRLNNETLHELALNGGILGMSGLFLAAVKDHTNLFGLPSSDITKTTDATALAIVRHFGKKTLIDVMNRPINFGNFFGTVITEAKKQGKTFSSEGIAEFSTASSSEATSAFLNALSINNAPMFNEFVRKILLDGDSVDLSIRAIYRLDAHNLSRYLAQHPETSVDELKQARAFSRVVNWKYKPGFDARLSDAQLALDREINFSLTVYRFLKDRYLLEPLTLIVMGYFERDQSIIQRVNYAIVKEKHPERITELKSIYPLIKERFKRDEDVLYKHDETKIVLDYLAGHTHMVGVALTNFKKENPKFELNPKKKKKKKSESKEEKKEVSSSSKSKFSLFGSKTSKGDKPKMGAYQLKIDTAQKAITDFVTEQNKNLEEKLDPSTPSAKPKTLSELKKYYEAKENKSILAKIEELEKGLGHAHLEYQQACIELVIQNWDSKKSKSESSIFSRKKTQLQLLQAEAKLYGYECKNVEPDGNCFFHAIAHQLSIQHLSHLGADHNALRMKAITYIIEHIGEFKDFLDEHDGDINNFINRNMDTGTWVDHLVILALSRSLNINIAIIRSDGHAPTIFRQVAPQATVRLGYEPRRHYLSLIENTSLTSTRNLQSGIDAAPVILVPGAAPPATASTSSGLRMGAGSV